MLTGPLGLFTGPLDMVNVYRIMLNVPMGTLRGSLNSVSVFQDMVTGYKTYYKVPRHVNIPPSHVNRPSRYGKNVSTIMTSFLGALKGLLNMIRHDIIGSHTC